MIYIGYRIEDDVVYKTLNGEKFKLVSYYSDSTWRNVGRVCITIETDEKEKYTFDFNLEKNDNSWGNERPQVYKHLHYFMITCTTLSDNDICIKNDRTKKNEDTWIPFLDWVDKLICPIKEFMQKRDKEMEAMNNIDKDFSD
jgi:hypothetical protein